MIDLVLHSYGSRFAFLHDPSFDVFDFLERASEGGYDAVAINCNGPQLRHLGGDGRGHVRAVRAALAERGLGLDIETSGTAPGHLRRMLDLAVALSALNLRTYTRHDGERGAVIEATIADLRAAAPLAAERGVPILLENHEEFTGREIARVLEAVDSDWVAALYDYGNSMMVHEDPLDCLDAMLPWIRKSHLKDHVVIEREGGQLIAGVPLGCGNLSLVETTRRLLAAGAGRIAFENVWSYTAAFRPRLDGRPSEPIGAGVFALSRPPWPESVFLPDVAKAVSDDPARVVRLEAEAFTIAEQNLRAILRDVAQT